MGALGKCKAGHGRTKGGLASAQNNHDGQLQGRIVGHGSGQWMASRSGCSAAGLGLATVCQDLANIEFLLVLLLVVLVHMK